MVSALFGRHRVIDVDAHLTEPPDVWTARVSSKWGDRVPHIERLGAKDVWMVGGFGAQGFLQLEEPALMLECVQAYNDFLIDWTSAAPQRLVLVSITPVGRGGPYSHRPATEFTVQAESGSIGMRGRPDQEPFQAGGRTTDWATGTFAAVGALAAAHRSRHSGHGEHVDVSMLETMSLASTAFLDLFWRLFGRPAVPHAAPPTISWMSTCAPGPPTQDFDSALTRLLAAGIPAAAVTDPRNTSRHPQMAARLLRVARARRRRHAPDPDPAVPLRQRRALDSHAGAAPRRTQPLHPARAAATEHERPLGGQRPRRAPIHRARGGSPRLELTAGTPRRWAMQSARRPSFQSSMPM